MAIYSMNNEWFAGPKSDVPWKPSPAMKMRQAAAAERVQTSAKQDALDLQNNAANAALRRQVEAATLRQQLASLNPRTLGRDLPLSSGPKGPPPRLATLHEEKMQQLRQELELRQAKKALSNFYSGLSGNPFASNLPAIPGLASRNALSAPSAGGSTARLPTTPKPPARSARGGGGSRGGGGRSGEFGKPMTNQLEPKAGNPAGTGMAIGAQRVASPTMLAQAQLRDRQPGKGIEGLGRSGAMGVAMAPVSGGGTRGASPMMQKPALGGASSVTTPGGVLGQPWAGDKGGGSSAALGGVAGVLGKTSGLGSVSVPTRNTRFNAMSGPGERTLQGEYVRVGQKSTQPGADVDDFWKKKKKKKSSGKG